MVLRGHITARLAAGLSVVSVKAGSLARFWQLSNTVTNLAHIYFKYNNRVVPIITV